MKKRILIVDDEPHMRKLAEYSLRAGGYDFVFCEDGSEVQGLLDREKPDLIIMDVMMKVMTGLEALKLLREPPSSNSIPVIVLTGLGIRHNEQAKRSIGADAVIMKPYSPTLLLATAKELLAA
jgi:CheY-like chemotaxis protein